MIAIIYAGLAILPLGLLTFGILFLKQKLTNLNSMVVLSAGLATIAFEFFIFDKIYAEAINNKLWNSIATPVSYFPMIVSFTAILVCTIVFCFSEIFKFKNKNFLIKISLAIAIFLLSSRVYLAKNQDTETLNTIAILSKSDVTEVLRKYAEGDNIDFKLAIISNKNTPDDLILKFSQSENEMVRYYSTGSSKLSIERLTEMKTSDTSKEVRKQAQNELDFSRKK